MVNLVTITLRVFFFLSTAAVSLVLIIIQTYSGCMDQAFMPGNCSVFKPAIFF